MFVLEQCNSRLKNKNRTFQHCEQRQFVGFNKSLFFRQSQESKKEMKIMLDVYKGASKDSRERLEVWYGMVWWSMVGCGMVWYGIL